jgi:hypothetical protein
MAIDKKMDYIVQDGYQNYIKNSDSITVPQKFKSRKNAAQTKLAYITGAEAKQLKKQNKGTPHKGPKGIPSYDDFDAAGNYRSGAAMSAAETGAKTERQRADLRQAGVSPQEAIGIRTGAVAAGARGSKAEERAARQAHPKAFRASRRGTGIGGWGGNILRGIMSIFGGIPGKAMSLLSRIDPRGLRGKNPDGSWRTQDEWQEDKDERIRLKNIDRILKRNKPITSFAQTRLEDLGYTGEMPSIGSTGALRQGNELGLFADKPLSINPEHYNDLGNEFALSTSQNNQGVIPGYDQEYNVNTAPYRLPPVSEYEGINFNKANIPIDAPQGIDQGGINYLSKRGITFNQGGRVGYQGGELVTDESMMEATPEGMMQENVEEVQEEPSRELLEALAMEIFQLPLEELNEEQLMVVYQAAMQQQPAEEAVQEEDIQYAMQQPPMEEAVQEEDVQFAAGGGRAGYQFGDRVEQQTDFIEGPQGGNEFQETVVEGQEQPSQEQLEALAMEIFQLPLEELDEQQLLVVYQEAMQGQPMEEAVQEEDVQFAAQGGLAGLL